MGRDRAGRRHPEAKLPDMGYFRERAKPMGYGFLIGVLVGWMQPYMLGVAVPEFGARVFLVFQMGAAFAMVGLFLTNYLSMRRRVQQRCQRDKDLDP